jgi:sarcosine oxidase subunit alpha
MKRYDLLIIGGGPAGLSAAKMAAEAGLEILVVERDHKLGGQLVKQTHMFFGSEQQYAKTRGIDIAGILRRDIEPWMDTIEVRTDTTVVGLYADKVVTLLHQNEYDKVTADAILIATGASEKILAFENNDLPGVYGAGAVQTLMNVNGVLPGHKVIMVGSGNIGLIVSYQLLQAGVEVLMVLEAADTIGGYKVHASKLKRLGVDIRTRMSVTKAIGTDELEQVEIAKLDDHWRPIPGTEELHEVDALCISVGLSPMANLAAMAGAEMKFVNLLGGWVPIIDHTHETTVDGVFVAGDVCGVEEASSAIVEGYYTGLMIAHKMGRPHPDHDRLVVDYLAQLDNLRSGPFGEKTRLGLAQLRGEDHA